MAPAVLVLCLLLIQAPLLVKGNLIANLLFLSPIWLAICVSLLKWSQRPSAIHDISMRLTRQWNSWLLFFLFIVVQLLAFVRAMAAGTISASEAGFQILLWSSVTVFGLTTVLLERQVRGRMAYLTVLGVTVYIVTAIALFHAGVRPTVNDDAAFGTTARLLSIIGIETERVLFPMATGLNNFGVVGGLAMSCGLVIALRRSDQRLLGIFATIAGLYVILRTDSRMSLLAAIGGTWFALVLPRRRLRTARYLTIPLVLSPVVIVATGLFLATRLDNSLIVREATELQTAGRRTLIWGAVAGELQSFQPAHLAGFGYLGQTKSSVVQRFGNVVCEGFELSQLTAHNSVLQQVLDTGYVGAFLFLAVLWVAIKRAADSPDSQFRRPLIAGLIYLLISGAAQTSPSPYYRETFVVFLLLAIAAIGEDGLSGAATASAASGGPSARSLAT